MSITNAELENWPQNHDSLLKYTKNKLFVCNFVRLKISNKLPAKLIMSSGSL